MAYYECSLSMEAAYLALGTLKRRVWDEDYQAREKAKTLRARLGLMKLPPAHIKSATFMAAYELEEAIEDRIARALKAGEPLSSDSEITVLIWDRWKEPFDDAVEDADADFDYRERRIENEDAYEERGYISLREYFAPEEDEDVFDSGGPQT